MSAKSIRWLHAQPTAFRTPPRQVCVCGHHACWHPELDTPDDDTGLYPLGECGGVLLDGKCDCTQYVEVDSNAERIR